MALRSVFLHVIVRAQAVTLSGEDGDIKGVGTSLNRRLWPFTALNSWTGSLSTGFKSWLELYLNRRQPRFGDATATGQNAELGIFSEMPSTIKCGVRLTDVLWAWLPGDFTRHFPETLLLSGERPTGEERIPYITCPCAFDSPQNVCASSVAG
jgi:hypothetical protein